MSEHIIKIKNETSGATGGGARGPKDPNNEKILKALSNIEKALRSKKPSGAPVIVGGGGGTDPKALKPFFDKLSKAISSNPAMDTRKLETLIRQLIKQQAPTTSTGGKSSNINIDAKALVGAIKREMKNVKVNVTPEIDERKITQKVSDAVKAGVKKAAPEVKRELAQLAANKVGLDVDVRDVEQKIRKVKKDLDSISGKEVPVNVKFTGQASTKEELGTKIKHIISDIDDIGKVNPEVIVSVKGDSGKPLSEELAEIKKSVLSAKGTTKGELKVNLPKKSELENIVKTLERIKDIIISVDIKDVIKAQKALDELDKKEIKPKKVPIDFDYEAALNVAIKEISEELNKADLTEGLVKGIRLLRDEVINTKKELNELIKKSKAGGISRTYKQEITSKISEKKEKIKSTLSKPSAVSEAIDKTYEANKNKRSKALDASLKAIEEQTAVIKEETGRLKSQSGRGRIQFPAAKDRDVLRAKEQNEALRSLRSPSSIPALDKSKLIEPSFKPGDIRKLTEGWKVPNYSQDVKTAVEDNVNSLSKSLADLQDYMVKSLEKSFRDSAGGWEIVRGQGEKISDYFTQAGGRTSKQSKQWRVQAADVRAIKGQVPSFEGGDTKALIKEWRASILNELTKAVEGDARLLREQVAKWLKITPEADIQEWEGIFEGQKISGDYRKKLIDIKKAHSSVTGISEAMLNEIELMVNKDVTELTSLFRDTMGKIESERTMSEFKNKTTNEKVLRTVAIPAARLTPSGAGVFETGSGSQRGLAKFATFISGFEDLYGRLADLKIPGKTQEFSTQVASFTKMPPKGSSIPQATDVVSKMLKTLVEGTKGTAQADQMSFIKEQYKKAGVMRSVKMESVLGEGEGKKFSSEIDTIANSFKGIDVDGLMKSMDSAGVSVLDFAKSLDAVKFENVYDVYKKVFEGRTTPSGKEVRPLAALGEQPQWEGRIRDFEKAVRQVEQLMPIVDPSRPRRALHQESSVNLLTRTSPVFAKEKSLGPPEQKLLIKNTNIRLDEMVSEVKALGKMGFGGDRLAQLNLPKQIRTISSLGIPESQAGSYVEYKERGKVPRSGEEASEDFKEGIEYLKALDAVSIKMYTDNLRELAPFAMEFQQLGRNIANVTNAMSSDVKEIGKMPGELITGRGTEFPGLRTGREKQVIAAGRYGEQGYGFNVMAELRNTAGTFEDQVLISGKLAEALTSTVKKLVQPSAMGRIYDKNLMTGGDPNLMVEDVRTGLVKDLPKAISEVAREFQKVLGEPQTYKGRADKSLIEEVQKVISIVRGEDVEVQQAKLAEVFLTHFGTKFTTRYGSKGVASIPQTGQLSRTDILNAIGNKEVKILSQSEREKAGLGVAAMPKTMGEMAAEMLQKDSPKGTEELQKQLKMSGNKFIIDMFKDVDIGVVADSGEITTQQELFRKFSDKFTDLFEGASTDIDKMNRLREAYKKTVGKQVFKEVPIDIRISSHGVAKRGLQTELLEMAMSNVAGGGAGSQTTIKTELGKKGYEYLLGAQGQKGALTKYAAGLGFEGPKKGKADIEKDITSRMVSQIDPRLDPSGEEYKEELKNIQEYARKAANLESMFNMYVDVVDELGEKRRSLVGEKFVQIIEQPHGTKAWTKREIEQGKKGEKLNLPAFAAYATIFGEESKVLDEIKKTTVEDTREHWEYIKSLQIALGDNAELRQRYLNKTLKTIDVESMASFIDHTGRYVPAGEDRSFEGTVFDIENFPTEFALNIPKTKGQKPGQEMLTEKFLMPGALARGTYPEPLIAGEFGPKPIARRLQQIVNAALEASSTIKKPTSAISGDLQKSKMNVLYSIKNRVEEAKKLKGAEAIPKKEALLKELMPLLSQTDEISESIGHREGKGLSEAAFINKFLNEITKGDRSKRLSTTLNKVLDIVIGPKEEIEGFVSSLDKAASNVTSLIAFGKNVGVDVQQDIIDKKLATLERAKIAYYEALSETVLGKTGSIAKTFFTRKIPSVMAKAVTATVDKSAELADFSKRLSVISGKKEYSDLGLDSLNDVAKKVDNIKAVHTENIDKYIKSGLPVLKQHEIGVPKTFAKKIPVKFTKRFDVDEESRAFETVKENVDGTLYDLLSYRDELERVMKKRENEYETSFKGKTTDLAKKSEAGVDYHKIIREYVDEELVPYIESVRYPFTGTSSVQPFKAKLTGGAKMNNVLAVPGMPEMDLDEFSTEIEKVRKVREDVFQKREAAWEGGAGQEEISRLTKLIQELDKAISDVIPKYISHQQKLDYDGDTIQIHSATMAGARQEIKKHFDTLFHSTDQLKDSAEETASVFRDQFTYDARQASTGEYILAEMMRTFGKKFPEEKGFEFLKKPFFTKELEYLSPEKQAEVLGGVTGAGAQSAIENAIKESIREESMQSAALDEVRDAAKDSNATAKSMLDAITNKETKAFVIEGIKTELLSKKYADAIEAQLFKIHTGPDVEAVNRLRRMSESVIGFGGGMVGSDYKPQQSFSERWPEELKAFGTAGPSGEFHTMLNELERFAIQKGMDVKHAGEKPVAGEMVRLLQEKGGTGRLLSDIQEKDDYSEFKAFGKANEEAIKNRLGKMSTDMIRTELSVISKVRGKDVEGIDTMDRSGLVDEVINLIGLKGFLEELQMQIKEEAIKGAKKYHESLEGATKKYIVGTDLSSTDWAEKEVSRFFEGKGDPNTSLLKKYITDSGQSMYPFRTFSAEPATFQRKQATEKHRFAQTGKGRDPFDPSQFAFDPMVAEKTRAGQVADMKKQYLRAKATAVSVEETMRGLRSEGAGGAYGQLMQSTLDNINMEQQKIDEILAKKANLTSEVEAISPYDVEGILDIQKRIEKYSKLAGTPKMAKQEGYALEKQFLSPVRELAEASLKEEDYTGEQYEEKLNAFIDGYIDKIKALKQIDRIMSTIESRAPEKMFFATMFPETAVKLPPAASKRGTRVKAEREAVVSYPGYEVPAGGPPLGPGGGLPPSMRISDDVVKVFVVGVASGVGLVLGDMPTTTKPGVKLSGVSDAEAFNQAISDLDADAVRRVADDIERMNESNVRARDIEGEMWQSVTPPGGRQTAPMKSGGTKIPGMSGYDDIEKKVKSGVYEGYTKPQDIVTGSTITAVFENLKMLHAQATAYQQTNKLISVLSINNKEARDEIEGLIGEAAAGGPDYKTFIEATSRMRDIEGTMTGGDVFKAWKLYRIAVGDFLLNRAEEARRQLDEAEAAGDESAATRAYGDFESNIVNIQKYIKRAVGKPTDIYTERKSYLDPELAKAAGVFLTKGEIIGKATAPLGEDEDLVNLFNKLTSDLKQGSDLKSPTSKIRDAFKDLSKQNDELVDILLNAEQLKRVGPEVAKAWDFESIVMKVSRLRAALEQLVRFKPEDMMTAEYEENLRTMVKYLKSVESAYVPFDTGNMPEERSWGQMGTKRVPKYLDPKTQTAMHQANIKKVQEYFKVIESAGGPKIGERYSYVMKVFGDMGDVIGNTVVDFYKYGEALNAVGEKVSLFKEKSKDIFSEKESRKSFRAAMGRALRWGVAAKVVYGGAQYLGNMVDMVGDVEMAMAQLRMVMSPLESDFPRLQDAAVSFAKEYGVAITDVLKGMKIFAQQGLRQVEVIDRTKTATLAANVTTLNAFEATEALTAAMKIYAQEGESSIRFLDAWSEVEAKHAITAGDLANALKKSASAAKNAGVDFDQLNGIVAAIGSTTRQSGKEVGTSLRFIFRRLTSEKGPKELAKLGIATSESMGGTQGLKSGFNVLSELSGKWDMLTSAQKMNIAQAIGGTRQYNSLLVLMDNWGEALSTIQDSVNSKGSAERRNMEVMKTYQKQLEQTKQAANELKLEFGKAYLPIAKFGLKGMRGFLETLSAIPGYLKAGAVGLTLFFTYMAKGESVVDGLVSRFRQLISWFAEGKEQLSTGWKVGLFESFGLGNEFDPKLKNLNKIGTEGGKTLDDFHSSLGKTSLLVTRFGKAYTKFVTDISSTTGRTLSSTGKPIKEFGKDWSILVEATSGGVGAFKGAKKGLDTLREAKGLGKGAVGKLLADKSAKSFLKLGGRIAGLSAAVAVEVAALSAAGVGKAMETIGDSMEGVSGQIVKSFAGADAGVIKSIAPLALTIAALIPTFKVVGDHLSKNIRSAQDYEKALYNIKRAQESELQTVRSLGSNYDILEQRLKKVQQSRDPNVKARKQELGTYRSPLLEMADLQKDATNLTNNLADSNTRLAAGYDKFGNAILNTTGSLKQYINELEKINVKQIAKTDIDVLGKYVTDLTEVEGPEKWKSALKTFVGEVPVVGGLLAKGIKLSPAKVLDEMTTKLNKLVAGKAKAPLTTAFDKDIKDLQAKLKQAREGFGKTYTDFRRVLSNITTEGLGSNEIAKMFGAEGLRKGFELMVEVEPRFNLRETKGKVKWEDVLGAEVMRRTFAKEISSMYDATSALTKGRLETAGIKPREGKAASGDIVTFTDDVAKRYHMAGQQARLSLKETTDGLFEWVVNYFNTKTLRVEERPFDDNMMELVDQIFPVQAIEADMMERVEQLNSFVAGASAGLVGISAKDFKRDFSLGERFFSDIPTTTLIQGTQGFTPGTGTFGESPFQSSWKSDFNKYFAEPMKEYRLKLEQVDKLRLEGLHGEETGVSFATGLYEELTRLQEVLKNNQVALQYRAVFADLTKTMEAGTRTIKENIAVEKTRQDLQKSTVGLMKGFTEGLDNIDTGIRSAADLTVKQRALRGPGGYAEVAGRFKETAVRRTGLEEQIYSIDKSLVALESIGDVSKGFGAALTPDEMKKYVDTITRVEDESARELVFETSKVVDNTSATVDRLDSLLEKQGDLGTLEKSVEKWSNPKAASIFPRQLVDTMERIARRRVKFEAAGDQKNVVASNKALDILTKNLVQAVGLKKAMRLVDVNFTLFSKQFQKEELAQRAFGGMDLKTFTDKMGEKLPAKERFFFKDRPAFEQTKHMKGLLELQKEDGKRSKLDSKELISLGADVAVWKQFDKGYSNRVLDDLKVQTKDIREKAAPLKAKSVRGETLTSGEQKELEKLDNKLKGLYTAINQEEKTLKRHNFIQWAAGLSAGSMELAKMFGLTESQVKKLGAGTLGLYAAFKALEVSGEDVPESFKKFDTALKKGLSKQAMGFNFGIKNMYDLGKAGKEMSKEFKDISKKKFTRTPEDEEKLKRAVLGEEERKATKEELGRGGKDIDRLKQVLAVVITDTLTGIALKAQEEKTRISTLANRAGEQSAAISDIITSNMAAAQQTLEEMYAGEIGPSGGRTIVPTITEEISAVIDSEKERMKVEKDMMGVRETLIAQYEEEREAAAKLQEQLASIEMYETFRKNIEDTLRNASAKFEDFTMRSTLTGPSVLNPALKGFSGESELPMLLREMTIQQQAFMRAGERTDITGRFKEGLFGVKSMFDINPFARFFNLMEGMNEILLKGSERLRQGFAAGGFASPQEKLKAFSYGQEALPEMVNALSSLMERRRELTSSGGGYMSDSARKEYKELNKQIDASEEAIEKLTEALREMGPSVRLINDLATAMHTLNDSVQSLTLKEQMEDFFKTTDRNLSNLIGGGGINAVQMTTLEEQRSARMAGMNLQAFDTQRNKEMAALAAQRRTAGGGKESADILRQMRNLDREFARRGEAEERNIAANRVREQVDALKSVATSLTEALRGPEFNTTRTSFGSEALYKILNPFETASRENRREEITSTREYIRSITDQANKTMTIADKLKELEANRDVFDTDEQYKEAIKRIKPRDDMDESQKQLRGVMPHEQVKLQKRMEKEFSNVAETLESYSMEDMQSMVTNPLHRELSRQTKLLEAINVNTGGESEDSDIFTELKKISPLHMMGFNTGGRIFGEGGPREDKVPAYLSPGEFVIKASSAQRIGYDALGHMNKKGNVPTFANGGTLIDEKPQRKIKTFSDTIDGGIRMDVVDSEYEKQRKKKNNILTRSDLDKIINDFSDQDRQRAEEDTIFNKINIMRQDKDFAAKHGKIPKTVMDPYALIEKFEIYENEFNKAFPPFSPRDSFDDIFTEWIDGFEVFGPKRDGGVIQGFAGGGGFFKNLSEIIKESGDFYTDKRLSTSKDMIGKRDVGIGDWLTSSVKMGALAVPEIGTKIAGELSGLFATLEATSTSLGKGTLGEDVSNVVGGIKQAGFKGIASSMVESFKDDLAKGGTGITAGLLEAFIPGIPLGSKLSQTVGKVPTSKKMMSKFSKKFDTEKQLIELIDEDFADEILSQRSDLFDNIIKSDPKLAKELYYGSTDILGEGTEALVFGKGKEAIRINKPLPKILSDVSTKIDEPTLEALGKSEYINKIKEVKDYKAFQVIRSKKLKPYDPETLDDKFMDQYFDLEENLEAQGLDFWDIGPRNVGIDKGRLKVLDYGAVKQLPVKRQGGFKDNILEAEDFESKRVKKAQAEMLADNERRWQEIYAKHANKESMEEASERIWGDLTNTKVVNLDVYKGAKKTPTAPVEFVPDEPKKSHLSVVPKREFVDDSLVSKKDRNALETLRKEQAYTPEQMAVLADDKFIEYISELPNEMYRKPDDMKKLISDYKNTYLKIEEGGKINNYLKALSRWSPVATPSSLTGKKRPFPNLTGRKVDTKDVYYHGAPHKFDIADIKTRGSNPGNYLFNELPSGAFFSKDPEYASLYTDLASKIDPTKEFAPHIIPANLNIKNPLDPAKVLSTGDITSFKSKVGSFSGQKNVNLDYLDTLSGRAVQWHDLLESARHMGIHGSKAQDLFKSMGFDGIVHTEGVAGIKGLMRNITGKQRVAAAWDSDQVKSIWDSDSKKEGGLVSGYQDGGLVSMKGYKSALGYLTSTDYDEDEPELKNTPAIIKAISEHLLKTEKAEEDFYFQRLAEEFGTGTDLTDAYNMMTDYKREYIPENEQDSYDINSILATLPKKETKKTKKKEKTWGQRLLEKYTGRVDASGSKGVRAITGSNRQKQLKEMGYASGGMAKNIDYRQIVPEKFTDGLMPKGKELNWDSASSYLSQQYIHAQKNDDTAKMKEVMEKIKELNKLRKDAGEGELGATTLPNKEAIARYVKERGVRTAQFAGWDMFTKGTFDRMGKPLGGEPTEPYTPRALAVKRNRVEASKSYEDIIKKVGLPAVDPKHFAGYGVKEERQLPSMKLAGITKIGDLDYGNRNTVDKLTPDVQSLVKFNTTLKDFDMDKAVAYYKNTLKGDALESKLKEVNKFFGQYSSLTEEMVDRVEGGAPLAGRSGLNTKLHRLTKLHEYFETAAVITGASKKESKLKELESLLGGKDFSFRGFMASTQGFGPGEKVVKDILAANKAGETGKVSDLYKGFTDKYGEAIEYRSAELAKDLEETRDKRKKKKLFEEIKKRLGFGGSSKKEDDAVKKFVIDSNKKGEMSRSELNSAIARQLFGQQQAGIPGMMHTGGEVQKTGNIFLQKGEHVIPGYAEGGLAEVFGSDTQQMRGPVNQTLTVEIDNKLEEMVSRLETTFANPPEVSISVPTEYADGIPVNVSNVPESIPVVVENIPESISVDADDATRKLQEAVNNITIDINREASVGADAEAAIKDVASLVEDVESKLSTKIYNVEKEVKEDIEIIKAGDSNSEHEIDRAIDQKIAALRLDIDDYSTKSRLTSLERVAGEQHADKARISSLEYSVQRIQNDQIRLT